MTRLCPSGIQIPICPTGVALPSLIDSPIVSPYVWGSFWKQVPVQVLKPKSQRLLQDKIRFPALVLLPIDAAVVEKSNLNSVVPLPVKK